MTDPAAATATAEAARHSRMQCVWLFSPTVDLVTFLGSAVLALALLAAGAWLGILHSDSPGWTWVTAVLLIDVAHVYATGFRVYADRQEFLQRRWLYILTPVLAFLIGWAIYTEGDAGPTWFWRVLAYMAVFHFVRQQYGWVALYRARAGDRSRAGRWIDSAAIYLATVYPLVWWHSHLPRNFWWFLEADFAPLPALAARLLEPLYWLSLLLYCVRSLYQGLHSQVWNPGKDIVVATTAICWYVGIISLNSDYAFTVTNVIIHGIPYFVLIYRYRYEAAATGLETESPARPAGAGLQTTSAVKVRRVVFFLGTLWLLAFVEELLWDRGVWGERGWLFGAEWFHSPRQSERLQSVLVPLLAVPQITHYILDGFIWKRRSNSRFRDTVEGMTK